MLAITPAETMERCGARPFQPRAPVQAITYPGWSEALRAVAAALARPGVVLVLAPDGGGKSLFLETLAEQLAAAGLPAGLRRPGSDPSSDDRPIVLVDQAERLSPDELLAISRSGRRFVLAGTPDLGAQCTGLAAVHTVVTLAPLQPREMTAFLEGHLVQSGHATTLLLPGTASAIAAHAEGLPGAALSVAGLAAFLAWLEGARQIAPSHVDAAIQQQASAPRPAPAIVRPAPALTSLPMPITRVRQAIAMPAERRAGRGRAGIAALTVGACGCAAVLFMTQPSGPAVPEAAPVTVALAASDAAVPTASPPPVAAAQPTVAVSMPPSPLAPPPSATVPVHASVSFRRDDALGPQHAAELARLLREAGIDVTGPETGGAAPGDPPVAYFYAEDAPAAADLARLLGQSGLERQMPARGPPPRPGAVRVTVQAGRAIGPARTNPVTARN